MYFRIGSQPYEPSPVVIHHCLPTSAPQGELYIIDENNEIYFLPCGDLCEEEIPTDDDSVSYTYQYLGCYTDNSDRIFSGNFLLQNAEMTTEVNNALRLNHTLVGFMTEVLTGENLMCKFLSSHFFLSFAVLSGAVRA